MSSPTKTVTTTSEQLSGEEEFNKGFILPTLLIQLRKILDQYPDDIQILKELIQNAEDAGATVVKFLYDARTYGQESGRLLSPGLAKYQGPALYAYNDAQFNEEDWKGIRMLLQSVKQNDPHKVGYFGMGFKSVFHITDLPSILSGDRLGIIDPLRQFFEATGSHAWNLSRDGPTVFRASRHQTDAYVGTFGCELEHFENGHSYPGTLLRFPLRTAPSALSDTVYGADRIRSLLDRFEEDAHLNLLFLRSVETIEIYERSSSGGHSSSAAADPPVLRYRVSVADEDLVEVRRHRREFSEKIQRPVGVSVDRAPSLDRPVISTYPVAIRSTRLSSTKGTTPSTSKTTSGARYLVTNYHCGGPVSAVFRKLHRDPELRLLPCVGTAMSLDDITSDVHVVGMNSSDEHTLPLLPYSEGGRVFCFLPLPDDGSTNTGLPIHVNGSFALEANRKHLKWPSSSSSSISAGSFASSSRAAIDEHLDRRLLWNQCLLREALPNAYAAMLVEAIRIHGAAADRPFSASAVYRAIPNFDGVDRRWDCILPGLFAELFKQPSVYTPAGGGQWIEPRHAVFDTVTDSPTDAEAATIILDVLREAGVKITDAPPHVQLAIRRSCRFSPTEISPTVVSVAVRTVLHRIASGVGDGVFRIEWDSRLQLLRYFLRRGKCDLLDGLELLPLANGGFETFRYNPRKADRPIYVAPNADVYRLLLFTGGCSSGGLEDDFLEMEIDKNIRKMLLEAIKKGFTQLKVVDGPSFCQLLPRALPKHWTNPTTVGGHPPQSVEWRPGGDRGQPPAGWLESVWRYLTAEAPDDLGPVDRLPLVPARASTIATNSSPTRKSQQPPHTRSTGGKGTSPNTATAPVSAIELVPLYSPTAAACVVRRSDGGLSLGHELESILVKLGIRIVDALPDYVRAHPLVEKNYVYAASYVGVLRAVERQSAVDGRRRVVDRFGERLTAVERRKLRELFAKVSDHELEPEHRDLLAQLPLFETVENNGGRRHATSSGSSTSNFACAADVPLAAPVERVPGSSTSGSLSFPVSKKLLDVSTPDAHALARLLNVRRLEPAELIVDVVFGDVLSGFHDVAGVRRVAVYVFHHYQRLSVSDPRFKSALQTLAFIERRGGGGNSTNTQTGSGGSFVTSDQLYDPEDELLRRLFLHDDRWYPAQSYCDPTSLVILRDIGLRKAADLTPADLIQTANRVAELASEARISADRIGDKSAAVFEYLQRYPDMLDRSVTSSVGKSSNVANALSGIAWVRRLVGRPPTIYPSGLSWYSTATDGSSARQTQYHCPSEMVPRRYATAVGSAMPTVGVEHLSAAIERAFGWDAPPPVAAMVRHLANVVTTYSGRDKPMYADISRSIYSELVRHASACGSTDARPSSTSASVNESFEADADADADESSNGVFEEPSSALSEFQTVASTEVVSSILSSFDAAGLRSWVWYGDGFSPPDRVVLSAPTFADLRPYVYGLPTELGAFHDVLLSVAGVRTTCQLTDVLRSIKTKYDRPNVVTNSSSSSSKQKTGIISGVKSLLRQSPSSASQHPQQFASSDIRRDLHICVSVLNELKSQIASACFDSDVLEALRREIFLPVHCDDRGVLKMAPLSECTYCDEEWLRQGYNMSDFGINVDDGSDRISLVHADVPTSTSEVLGVPTLMSRMLAAEQTLDFGFGQTDSLTGRLKALLDDYSDGLAIPKELIQNADDAGATEVKFLYDERENSDSQTCLLDEGMRECQGPALWVYNDATFTDADFENITRLGAATKVSRNDQIGRFGLGFNAVYNLTDVPSFLSCHSVVIFDPQCGYLGRCIRDRSRPGVRIDLRRHRRSLRRFGNQFRPWDGIFGCDLLRSDTASASRGSASTKAADSFPGTLFRLPLRTAAQAARSEICNRAYDDREMKELLKMIVSTAESLLLFAQNVVRIRIYHLPKRSTNAARDVVEIFTVERKLVRILRELIPSVDPPHNASKMLANNDIRRLVKNSCLLRSSTLAMSQLKSGANPRDVSTPDSSLVVDIESSLCGKPAAALLDQPATGRRQTWLVCSVMGQEDSLKMALLEENLVPSAAVAIKLEQLGKNEYRPVPLTEPSSMDQPTGLVFSFMPLPIRTGLPVHINGCFLVTSSRKHLCQANEDDKFDTRPTWNRALLRDSVQASYVRALQDITILCNCQSADEMFKLWPNPEFSSSACDALVEGFFSSVTNTSANTDGPGLFSDGQRWVSAAKALFLEGLYASSSVGSAALAVFRMFIPDSSKIVCSLPQWIESSLRTLGGFENITVNHFFSQVRFFEELFLPRLSDIGESLRDSLLLDALKSNDPEILRLLQNCSSIPCSPDGQLTEFPHNLVDPTSSLAPVYLLEDGKFPHSAFASADILRILRQLGMKHDYSTTGWDEMVNRAEIVVQINDPLTTRRFVSSLLGILHYKLVDTVVENTTVQSDEVSFYREKLCNIAFFPVAQKPDAFPLPWFGDQVSFVTKPVDLFCCDYKDLICCIRPIADVSMIQHALSDSGEIDSFLRFDKAQKVPSELDVVAQLKAIVDYIAQNGIPSSGNERDEFQRVLFKVCDFLQTRCSDNSVSRQKIGDNLSDLSFILVADRMMTPDRVAFTLVQDCAPYLFSLPETYRNRFGDLVAAAGVRTQFDTGAFVSALRTMSDQHGCSPLDTTALQLALQLASQLNDTMTQAGRTLADVVDANGTIYIPDSNGILRSAAELCYNEPDCQWMQVTSSDVLDVGHDSSRAEENHGGMAVAFSHPLIPYAMSQQLGVSTRRHDVLQRHSRGLAFGQRERLTARLRRILAAYPCDRELLNEMVQNADDAGATTINFIKDPRRLGHERVFDPSWRSIQGPALCIYNDRTFTELDLAAIQRLGEGRKGTDPNTTGQYGVGFNCVYHLTDVPSFLTGGPDLGGTLCVFDPHAKMVPGATRDEPGRRFTDIPRLKRIFTDVFSGYLEDKGFDLANGTMFRLPLRDEQMASESELSDQVVTMDTVDRLFARFRPEMFDCLLFLNSVRSIQLSEINEHSGELSNTYTVIASLSPEDQAVRDEFNKYAKKVSADISNGTAEIGDIEERESVYKVRLSDNHGHFETWLVTQRLGFGSINDIPKAIIDGFRRGELMLMPRGGTAALIDSSNSKSITGRANRISCFLPLPLKLDFPVSVNGHFALDHESRRYLWHDDIGGSKTVWNDTLLRSVIAPSYVALLRGICDSFAIDGSGKSSQSGICSVENYCRLFPSYIRNLTGYWRTLVDSFYTTFALSDAPLFPVIRDIPEDVPASPSCFSSYPLASVEWHSLQNSNGGSLYLDNLSETFGDVGQPLLAKTGTHRRRLLSESNLPRLNRADMIRRVMLRAGFNLIAFPAEVSESFVFAGVGLSFISPRAVMEFCNGERCREFDNLPTDIADTPFTSPSVLKIVIEYCMQDSEYFSTHLDGLPLLLTQDGSLSRFSVRQPTFLSSFFHLFPGLESHFVHNLLCESVFASLMVDMFDVFRSLDVQSLLELLPRVLSASVYGPPNTSAFRANEENGPPTGVWLTRLWSFLRLEYERALVTSSLATENNRKLAFDIIEPLAEWCLLPVRVRSKKDDRLGSINGEPITPTLNDFERILVPVGKAPIVFDHSHAGIMTQSICRCLAKLGIAELDCDALDGSVARSRQSISSPPSTHPAIGNSQFARLLVSTLDQPDAVVHAVGNVTTDYPLLSREDCFCLLRYFADSIEVWRIDNELCRMLRSACLFVTITGEVTSLAAAKYVYVINDQNFPHCDTDIWRSDFEVVFLQHHHSLVHLYEALGCQQLSVVRFYLDFVFPNFARLSPDSRICYLEFVRDSFLPRASLENRQSCVDGLRLLQFIPSADVSAPLRRADEFYDPQHQLLKEMITTSSNIETESLFPGSPFKDHKWLDFLRIAGLRSYIGADMFKEFARSIAGEVGLHGATPSACERSRILVAHIFRSKEIKTPGFLEALADIKFIASSQGSAMLQKIHPAYERKTSPADDASSTVASPPVFIAFHEGISERYEPLCWTTVHLLPDWSNPYRFVELEPSQSALWREVGERLKIVEKPSVEHVVDHVMNLCNQRAKNGPPPKSLGGVGIASQSEELKAFLLADTMKKIYRYLHSKIVGNSGQDDGYCNGLEVDPDEVVARLSNAPCVVIEHGKTFLYPSQIVLNFYNEDQLVPFLYRLPSDLCEFRELFSRLGSTSHATPCQYAFVLANIHSRTNGGRLHPNELRLAFKAVRGLFASLSKYNEQGPDETEVISTLYLPTDDGQLTDSSLTVYNDRAMLGDRLKHINQPLLVDLSECGINPGSGGGHSEVLQLLPDRLRPRALSSVVVQVLDERYAETRIVTSVTERVRCQLSSRSFGSGLVRLLCHEQRQRSAASTSSGDRHRSSQRRTPVAIETIRRRFDRIEVFVVDRVVTYLADCTSGLPLSDSESEAEWFVECRSSTTKVRTGMPADEGDVWTIYVDKSVNDGEELQTHIADAVSEITDGLLANSVHYLRPILSCAPHAISRTLDRLRVRPDQGRSGSDSEDRRRSALPAPGSFVPIEEHHLLREEFDEFEPGEYVGFELDERDDQVDSGYFETTIVYAIVIRKIDGFMMSDEEDAAASDTAVGDGRGVVDGARENSSSDLGNTTRQRITQKYLLNIGDDRRPVIGQVMNIYKFHRVQVLLSGSSAQSPNRSPLSPNGRSPLLSQTKSPFLRHTSSDRETAAKNSSRSGDSNGVSTSNSQQNGDTHLLSPPPPHQNGHHLSPGPPPINGSLPSPSEAVVVRFSFDQRRTSGMAPSNKSTDEVESDIIDVRISSASAEVTEALVAAWKLPEPQRRKVVRRLLLRWHPDKNVGDEQLATAVTQHIQAEMERLDNNEAWEDGRFQADPRNPFSGSESFRRNFADAYRFFFDQMNERAREQRAQRDRYREHFSREYSYTAPGSSTSGTGDKRSSSTGSASPGGFTGASAGRRTPAPTAYQKDDSNDVDARVPPPTFASCNPQPAQARRFLRQARVDLKSAENDMNGEEPAYEWVCFKAYQSAKKALKAALIFVDSSHPASSHDVVILAAGLDDPELGRLSRDLDRLVADAGRKLYAPDPIDYAVIPHDEHTAESSTAARDLAAAILGRVGELIASAS